MTEQVNHPSHYGGADDPYEVIKVIEAWELDFQLGNAVKYIARAGRKTRQPLVDLRKARWYLDRKISQLEQANAKKLSPSRRQGEARAGTSYNQQHLLTQYHERVLLRDSEAPGDRGSGVDDKEEQLDGGMVGCEGKLGREGA